MKKNLLFTALVLTLLAAGTAGSSAQTRIEMLRRAEKVTEKGFADKKTTFCPERLDSLTRCGGYVMLISSYEGCGPCEWLRTSDVFDTRPVTPYYNDFMLGGNNDLVPWIFFGSGFPTCAYFDGNGDVVAITIGGGGDLYGKLERIIEGGETVCDLRVGELSAEQTLSYYNFMYKAAVAHLRNDMDGVLEYATRAMELHPAFYNRYLLYRYHLARNDTGPAAEYRALLNDYSRIEAVVYKKLIAGLNAE